MSDSFATPQTVARQAPLSMGFSRQGYWSGLPHSPPGDLPNSGIEPRSPALQADSLLSEPPGKPHVVTCVLYHNSKNGDTSVLSEIIWRTFFPPQGTSDGTVPWNPLFSSPQ